ncbi:MAG TPA: hypothetical protein VFS24_21060 [Steroidobacteraceae bacterium]|nr:hypothetical protein [Steroidobacteraceae bacterium]
MTELVGAVPADRVNRFHLAMACAFMSIAFAGFVPSYWSKIATGTFTGTPIYHVHGLLLFGWTCLYLLQTWLVATGRTLHHRAWGMAGIAWFSVMMCSTLVLLIHSMRGAEALGVAVAAAALPITMVSFITIALASALFAAAIANVRRPAVHKRLMLLVMVVLVQAAIARLIVLPLSPTGPPSIQTTIATGVVADLLVAVAMFHDWRTLGRPHDVYVWGGILLVGIQVVIGPRVAQSEIATTFARSVQHLLD